MWNIFSDFRKWAWRAHYRIPEPAYWALWVAASGLVVLSLGLSFEATLLLAGLSFVAIQGIARWHWDRAHSRGAIVVPRFACTDEEKAIEIQNTILKTLGDHLNEEEMRLVHSIAAIASAGDREFAKRLCKRLRAFLVLHGDVRSGAGGHWSVYVTVCQPISPIVHHIDDFTRDMTPAKAEWRWAFRRLTGTDQIENREYPLEFAEELQAVVQATAGQLAGEHDDPKRAERLLREAMRVAPTSHSAQIDELRIRRASALLALDREDEAIRLLKKRAAEDDASPELLRDFAMTVAWRPNSTEKDGRDAVGAYRQALQDRSDPQRDMTQYNLAHILVHSPVAAERQEGREMIEELTQRGGHYRRVWHLKRLRGSIEWGDSVEAWERGDLDAQRRHGGEAAKWYSAAIRARPNFRFLFRVGGDVIPLVRFPTPPIMYANARDGHGVAGHRWRTRWYEFRFQSARKRLYKRGYRHFEKGSWHAATQRLDWVAHVGRKDPTEVVATTILAVAMKQRGARQQADELWDSVFAFDPVTSLAIRCALVEEYDLPEGVPGDQPTDIDEVSVLIAEIIEEAKATGEPQADGDPPVRS
jgi:hypothetical protein